MPPRPPLRWRRPPSLTTPASAPSKLPAPSAARTAAGTAVPWREGGQAVVHWMSRDQRVDDNWAAITAAKTAVSRGVDCYIVFALHPEYMGAPYRHFHFMLGGLREVEERCSSLGIKFRLLWLGDGAAPTTDANGYPEGGDEGSKKDPAEAVADFARRVDAGLVVTDWSPLRHAVAWRSNLVRLLGGAGVKTEDGVKREEKTHAYDGDKGVIAPHDDEHAGDATPVIEVDAHNVVPCWVASDKLEYAARTIRRKIHERAAEGYFEEFPEMEKVMEGKGAAETRNIVDWKAVDKALAADRSVGPVDWLSPGYKAGMEALKRFAGNANDRKSAGKNGFKGNAKTYDQDRNDPNRDGTSKLSPYFHFGHISPQKAVMTASASKAFVEEAFVRRELSDNHCYWNQKYGMLSSASQWAIDSLKLHEKDERKPAYSLEELEEARTGDDLWNAGQRQMVERGHMHGWVRMYWCKKILEWTKEGVEESLKRALYLNDKYSLDGRDPNGYVGIAWSILGVHDMGWKEREIFGKIRFMNYAGAKRKFDVPKFEAAYKAKGEKRKRDE